MLPVGLPPVLAALAADQRLSANLRAFMTRVYADGLAKYRTRLCALGFDGSGRVLDAGCGVGQWSLTLGSLALGSPASGALGRGRAGGQVVGVDLDGDRVAVCQALARAMSLTNTQFCRASLTRLPFADRSFDGAVCYSVLYLTDYPRAIAELGRVLRPGGMVYLSTNGLGRFLWDVVRNPNPAADFSPRAYGLRALANTIRHRLDGWIPERGAVAMSPADTARRLRDAGFEIVAIGAEGTLSGGPSFHPARFAGLPAVFDVLARRR